MEIWKSIPGYEDLYEITTDGRVRSLNYRRTGKTRELKLINVNEYSVVNLSSNGKRKQCYVHMLTAITFLKHIPDGHNFVVDHIDENKSNNKLENLQIITNGQNTRKGKIGKNKNLPDGVSLYKKKKNTEQEFVLKGN